MVVIDPSTLASEAYALAASGEPIAGLVKEALKVIDEALDEYGCAPHFSDNPVIDALHARSLIVSLLDPIKYP
jgi:hypothetical protein